MFSSLICTYGNSVKGNLPDSFQCNIRLLACFVALYILHLRNLTTTTHWCLCALLVWLPERYRASRHMLPLNNVVLAAMTVSYSISNKLCYSSSYRHVKVLYIDLNTFRRSHVWTSDLDFQCVHIIHNNMLQVWIRKLMEPPTCTWKH